MMTQVMRAVGMAKHKPCGKACKLESSGVKRKSNVHQKGCRCKSGGLTGG